MTRIPDIVTEAIRQRRDLRFWYDASRITMSPYILGLGRDGEARVAGVTADGSCVSFRCDEIVGVEAVARRPHPLVSWDAEEVETTLLAAS